MKRIVLATIATFSFITTMAVSANAADLPRSYQKAPIAAPLPYYNWSGFYLGINGGGGWGRSSFNYSPPFVPTGNFNLSGGMVGGTLGYNYQVGQAVFGLEGDIDWTNVRGSTTCLGGAFSCETKNDWLGTVRGRLGYAFDRWMPYVTGGLAVGDIKANVPGIGSASATKAGWTVGGGLEFAVVSNVTAKIEYLYVDLGSFDCGISCGGVSPTNVKFNENVVRAGLNWRF